MTTAVGYEEGETCNREGCKGTIKVEPVVGCSCHINPPCSACTTPTEHCPECDWQLVDEEQPYNGFLVGPVKPDGRWTHFRRRPLDNTKIDWHSSSHTHFTMIKEGVYPEGTTQEDVRAVVNGTFGGRFEYFGNGRFKFIAYTD